MYQYRKFNHELYHKYDLVKALTFNGKFITAK